MAYTYKNRFKLILSIFLLNISLASVYSQEQYSGFEKGNFYLLHSKHDSALYYFQKVLSEANSEQDWAQSTASLNKISEIYLDLFEINKAKEYAQRALDLSRKHLDEFHLERAKALNNVGNTHYSIGQHELALEYYNQALVITDKIEGDDEQKHLFASPTNMGIGNVYFSRLDYYKAFEHFGHALRVNQEILGDNHPYVANSYLSIANLHRNRGSYKLARENYDKALDIYKAEFELDHPSIGLTYVGIADIFKSSGAYVSASEYYTRAHHIYSKYFDDTINPKFGDIWLGYADIYKNQGDYASAIEYYEKALNLYIKTVGDQHQNTVQSYLGIGNTFIYQGKFREALDYYGRVLEVNFNLVGDNHENTSAAYNNLGSLYYFAGEFELSEKYFNKALKIDLAIHGKKHPNVANAYYNIARIYGEKGDTKTALDYVQLAISSSILDFDETNIFVNPALLNFFDNRDLLWYLSFKGELLEQGFSISKNMKGLDLAIHSFVQSDSLIGEIRRSYTDPKDERELAGLTAKIYESAVNGCYSALQILNQENVKQISLDADYDEIKAKYENWFFYFSEKKKGAILFSSLAESNAKSFGDIPQRVIKEDSRLKLEINRFTQEISYTVDSTKLAELQDSLFIVNRAYETLQLEMENNYPRYYELKYDDEVVDLGDFQNFLGDSTTAISYFIASDSLYTALITNDDFKIHKTGWKDNLEETILAFRNAIIYSIKPSFVKYANQLSEQLIPEDISDLKERLLIIPDGKIASIPFEALFVSDYNQTGSWTDFPFLVKDYSVSYTYSGNLLHKIFLNDKTVRDKAKEDLIAFAPVTFNAPYGDILMMAKEKSYKERGIPSALRKLKLLGVTQLVSIPSSEDEVLNINSSFDKAGKRIQISLREDATESRIKLPDITDFKYIHIASHGFVNQEEPEFSGIIFQTDSTKEDGILFTGEIYGLRINCELMSLSACETGLGKIKEGEGIIGITRALIYAGAKNITVSLWKVLDKSTEKLMTKYYSEFSDLDVPQDKFTSLDYSMALREAKLEMLEERKFAAPVHWASFVLVGK